ncbi:MAG: zinc ribbon domain-containing protein [Candidatus Electrothrix sp. MAN1_4]|nr:zinc ribbon domain-containing protein [Candidatus Electrothrix sp. MAN1_4]
MPIYEYECPACEKVYEVHQGINDAPLTSCSVCDGDVKKIVSMSSFHLKGGGWYSDGYASGSSAQGEAQGGAKGEAKGEVQGEAKGGEAKGDTGKAATKSSADTGTAKKASPCSTESACKGCPASS